METIQITIYLEYTIEFQQLFSETLLKISMGQSQSYLNLTVATLNFSGIIASPYQFFQTKDEKQLRRNLRFALFVNEYFFGTSYAQSKLNEMIKIREEGGIHSQVQRFMKQIQWKSSPIDKQWHENRHSPLYNWKVGIKNNKFMESKRQFYERWDQIANKHLQNLLAICMKNAKKKELLGQKQYIQSLRFTLKNEGVVGSQGYKDKQLLLKQLQSSNIPEKQKILKMVLFQLRALDYLAYKAILYQIYGPQKLTNLENSKEFRLDAKNYRQQRKKTFEKSYLNIDLKIKKTIEAFGNFDIDIFMIQETTLELIQAFQRQRDDIRIVKPLNEKGSKATFSSIIIKEKKFPKMKNLRFENSLFFNNFIKLDTKNSKPKKITEQQLQSLNINDDTVIQAIGNLIIICSHLSSKKEQNKKQLQIMKNCLLKLRYWFPDGHIIWGGDLNGQFVFQESEVKQKWEEIKSQMNKKYNLQLYQDIQNQQSFFNVFPTKSKEPKQNGQKLLDNQTTLKQRSFMQAQNSKADKQNFSAKDFIISNRIVKQTAIRTIDKDQTLQGKPRQSLPLLPNHHHPFDHFLIISKVQLPSEIIYVNDENYLIEKMPEKLTQEQLLNIFNKSK